MEKQRKQKVIFGSLKIMLAVTLLAAVSIICGKYLKIPVGDVMRFSFENLPVLLAGMVFGPLAGAITGVLADLVGCLMVGYQINPIVTVGAAAVGCFGGAVYLLCKKMPPLLRVGCSVWTAHLIGSVIIKTFGLARFYAMPFFALMGWRGINYLIVGALEWILLWILLRNKAVAGQLERMKR